MSAQDEEFAARLKKIDDDFEQTKNENGIHPLSAFMDKFKSVEEAFAERSKQIEDEYAKRRQDAQVRIEESHKKYIERKDDIESNIKELENKISTLLESISFNDPSFSDQVKESFGISKKDKGKLH